MRTFDTGATRDSGEGKLNYKGFLSPAVLRAFAEYMQEHRKQADGSLRAADNWKRGMPLDVYRESLTRHFMTLWLIWDGETPEAERVGGELRIPTERDALMGVLFNAMGLTFELLRGRAALKEAEQQIADALATWELPTPSSPPPSASE